MTIGYTRGKVVNSGPRQGAQPGGRRRVSLANIASKQDTVRVPTVTPPSGAAPSGAPSSMPPAPLTPSSALGLGDELAGAQYNFLAKLAALRQERAALNGNFRVAKATARSNRIASMVGIEGDSLSRGIVGSSGDLASRAGTVTQEAGDVAAAREARNLGKLDLMGQRIDASNSLFSTMSSIESQRAMEQAMNTIGQFQDNMFQDPNAAAYKDILAQLLAELQKSRRGETPRTRTGLGNPTTDPAAIAQARIAHLLREGL